MGYFVGTNKMVLRLPSIGQDDKDEDVGDEGSKWGKLKEKKTDITGSPVVEEKKPMNLLQLIREKKPFAKRRSTTTESVIVGLGQQRRSLKKRVTPPNQSIMNFLQGRLDTMKKAPLSGGAESVRNQQRRKSNVFQNLKN